MFKYDKQDLLEELYDSLDNPDLELHEIEEIRFHIELLEKEVDTTKLEV